MILITPVLLFFLYFSIVCWHNILIHFSMTWQKFLVLKPFSAQRRIEKVTSNGCERSQRFTVFTASDYSPVIHLISAEKCTFLPDFRPKLHVFAIPTCNFCVSNEFFQLNSQWLRILAMSPFAYHPHRDRSRRGSRVPGHCGSTGTIDMPTLTREIVSAWSFKSRIFSRMSPRAVLPQERSVFLGS